MKLINQTTSRDLNFLSFLCLCAALWTAVDFYHILKWSHFQGASNKVNLDSFPDAVRILSPYGLEVSAVPAYLIFSTIMLRFFFWVGSGIIIVVYKFHCDRPLGFILLGSASLDTTIKILATGSFHSFLIHSFGSIRDTFTSLLVIAAVVWLLFVRPQAKQRKDA